jgi:hypothetical protein
VLDHADVGLDGAVDMSATLVVGVDDKGGAQVQGAVCDQVNARTCPASNPVRVFDHADVGLDGAVDMSATLVVGVDDKGGAQVQGAVCDQVNARE